MAGNKFLKLKVLVDVLTEHIKVEMKGWGGRVGLSGRDRG